MKLHILEYKFHIITINLEDKEQEIKREYFERFEDLLKEYRSKKDTKAYGIVECYTDFKYYIADLEEKDIKALNDLL